MAEKIDLELDKLGSLTEVRQYLTERDFDCRVRDEVSLMDWKENFPEGSDELIPNRRMVCFWSEEKQMSVVTWGSIRVLVYAVEDDVLGYKVDDIYTGP